MMCQMYRKDRKELTAWWVRDVETDYGKSMLILITNIHFQKIALRSGKHQLKDNWDTSA